MTSSRYVARLGLQCVTLALSLFTAQLSALAQKPATGKEKPGDTITNSLGMKLAYIPAGEFLMGSPESETFYNGKHAESEKQHRVRITKSFYVGVYFVTRGEFGKFVVAEGYKTEGERDGKGADSWDTKEKRFLRQKPEYTWRNTGMAQTDDHPVVNMSWNDANAFCAWLSKRDKREYRLPTEAEWEYACRAGTTTAFAFGDSLSSAQANFDGNHPYGGVAKGLSLERTSSVGSYKPNGWGLYDMQGNAWEWCADAYDNEDFTNLPDNGRRGPSARSYRAIRGGGWNNDVYNCRCASRSSVEPADRGCDLGFRVVAER